MTTTRSKSIKYFIANHNGVEIYLSVPSKDAKEQKYYLDYNNNGQKKYYGNGTVKKRAVEFFNATSSQDKLKHAQLEFQLTELFKQDLELITHEIQTVPKATTVSMRTKVKVDKPHETDPC